MTIASDLEGTLTAGRTWKGLGRYLTAHGQGNAHRLFFLSRLPAALLARAGLRDEQAFQEQYIADVIRLLRGYSAERVREMAEWIVDHELWPKRFPAVLEELEAQRQAGRRVLIVSGTYQPVLDAFARRIGVEGLGTPIEMVKGRLTGRLAGPVNAGSSKVDRLHAALEGNELELAFGDTVADVPMLTLSKQAVVVNPKTSLGSIAQRNGWRIVSAAGSQ